MLEVADIFRAHGPTPSDGERWIACRPGFFLPVRVLSRLPARTRRSILTAI